MANINYDLIKKGINKIFKREKLNKEEKYSTLSDIIKDLIKS